GTHALASWLEPSVVSTWYNPAADGTLTAQPIHGHVSDTMTFVLMGIALGVGALGIGLAWALYGAPGKPSKTVEDLVDGPLRPAYEASKAKLWFDEIYEATIVK